jgi:hypothetical protein
VFSELVFMSMHTYYSYSMPNDHRLQNSQPPFRTGTHEEPVTVGQTHCMHGPRHHHSHLWHCTPLALHARKPRSWSSSPRIHICSLICLLDSLEAKTIYHGYGYPKSIASLRTMFYLYCPVGLKKICACHCIVCVYRSCLT